MTKNKELADRSRAHVWHPCTQMKDHEWLPLIPIQSAEGVWLKDYEGKRYLDAISSWWTNLFGHRHPHIVAALKDQLDKLDHVLLAGFTHEPALELAERLVNVAPKGLTHCIYTDNGSSAVEAALKLSHHYWRNVGKPQKKKFIALENGYHGETLGALAVGGTGMYRDAYEPLLMECLRVPSPDCYHRAPGEAWEDYSRRQFNYMLTTLEQHAGEVCAVILEPLVQCAGGMRMYHHVYLRMLREACDKHDVHLIADEIAVGFGRTGKMFASEFAKISPDLMCLSKGLTGGTLPLAVTMTTDKIYDAFYADYMAGKAFLHSHSYTGNPIACRAALASLDLLEKSSIMAINHVKAQLMWARTADIRSHPNVADVRQQGMILAIELAKNIRSKEPFPRADRRGLEVYRYGLKHGVLLRPLGDVIYFMPPYVIEPDEIELMTRVALEGIEVATDDG
jgi:adenosylmethionine---8-amino-7-oxononanoate aminotransferase